MSPVALVTADLDQNRRLKFEPALVVMLDAIAVFARSELRKRPFPRIQAIALLLHLDLIGARLVGDLEQLLEQAIAARNYNDALFPLDHLAAHLDRLGRAAADLNQHRRLEVEAALVVMLDAIAVFARSELRKRPFPRIQAIALLLHLDLIGARLVGDLEQLLEQAIGALFSRARVDDWQTGAWQARSRR